MTIISKSEKDKIQFEFNNNKYDYGNNQLYHVEFSKIAQENLNKCAIIFEGKSITYGELDNMSNSLAYYLRYFGIKRNDIVPIICERSYYYIVSCLGIMKAGGGFLYIDPEYPKERIDFMLNKSKAKIILKYLPNKSFDNLFNENSKYKVYDLVNHNFSKNTKTVKNINLSTDTGCIYFTSGTTGNPKGILISHDNIINCCRYGITYNGLTDAYEFETVLSFIKESYVLSLIDTLYPLIKNKRMVLCNNEEYNNPELLGELITKYNVDYIMSTPSRVNNYLKNEIFQKSLAGIKVFCFGGEFGSNEFFKRIIQYSNGRIFHGYGSTETTVICTFNEISRDDIINNKPVSIGHPNCNNEIYILDENLEIVPIGVEGDIYICGYSISQGYLNQEELTNEKFIDCPFHQDSHSFYKKMYKTGDIGKWTEDGKIICLGRRDFQVKIRGQRIELEEIESKIKEIEGISYSVVVCKNKENGEKYLVGYYMIDDENDKNSNSRNISNKEIRDYLIAKLPNYMVPNYLKRIHSLPINSNGKFDRKKLPDINIRDIMEEEYIEPSTDTEKIISEIYHEVFFVDDHKKIGKTSDFYVLGGDSLNAVKIVSKIKQIFNINIRIKEVMTYSTVCSLASFIDGVIKNHEKIYYKESIKKYHCNDEFPLLSITMRSMPLQLFKLYVPDHMIQYYRINESNNIKKLTEAFRKIIERHEILQVAFFEKVINGVPKVYCKKIDHDEFVIEHYKLENFKDFTTRPFDISKDYLIRVGLIEDKVMMVDLNHKIGDGYSFSVLVNELDKLYHDEVLEELPIQISDCSIYYENIFNNSDFSEQINYYKSMFNGNYELVKLPKKLMDKETQEKREKSLFRIFRRLKRFTDNKTHEVINKISCNYNLSKTAILLTVYCLVLSLYSGQREINTFIVNSNRGNVFTDRLIGLFARTIPVSVHFENKTLIDLIKITMENLLTIFSSDAQMFMLKEQLNIPQFNTLFKLDPYDVLSYDRVEFIKPITDIDVYKLFKREDLITIQKSKPVGAPYEFNISITERKDYFDINFSYDENLYEDKIMNEIIDKFIWIIKDEENFTKNINEFSINNINYFNDKRDTLSNYQGNKFDKKLEILNKEE